MEYIYSIQYLILIMYNYIYHIYIYIIYIYVGYHGGLMESPLRTINRWLGNAHHFHRLSPIAEMEKDSDQTQTTTGFVGQNMSKSSISIYSI